MKFRVPHLVLFFALAGCRGAAIANAPDAGSAADAGPVDGGAAEDAGANGDAGSGEDAGGDAGSPSDGGFDAGAADAGQDAGAPLDAGATVDLSAVPAFDAVTGCTLFESASPRTHILGHDGAVSVALDGGRALWVFGDTLSGYNDGGARILQGFIRNASAVVDISDLATCFDHVTYPGTPDQEAIVHPAGENAGEHAAWPGDLFNLPSGTWIYYGLVATGSAGPLDLVWQGAGVLPGESDPPRFFRPVPDAFIFLPDAGGPDAGDLDFGGSAVLVDGTLYVFGQVGRTPPGGFLVWDVLLAKVDPASIADPAAYQYFTGLDPDGGPLWSRDIGSSKPIFTGGAGGIRQNVYLNGYLAVYIQPLSSSVEARVSPTPWGPWSDGGVLAGCELPANASCYDVHQHAELGTPDGRTVVLTYNTNNLYSSAPLAPETYWPRLLTVTFR